MHRRTDPACIEHRTPRTRVQRWRYNRARGRACLDCYSPDFHYDPPDWLGTIPGLPWALSDRHGLRIVDLPSGQHKKTDVCPCPACQHTRARGG